MPTISYTPVGWNGSDSAPNAPETVRLEAAVQTAINTVQADLDTVEALAANVNYDTVVVPLAPGAASTGYICQGAARTVSALHFKRSGSSFAVGTFEVTIADADGNTLMSATPLDVAAAGTSFTSITLTATTANLALAAGEAIKVQLTSNSGGAGGGPLVVRATYA